MAEALARGVRSRRRADVIARLLVSYAVSAPDDPPEIVAAGIAEFVAVGALPLEPGETTSPGSTTRASVREESHPC